MKKMQIIFGGPEQAIFSIAMTQMGKLYELPVYINVGLTDSKLPDAQAGLECSLTLGMGTGAGADIFGHMGISGVDQAGSLDMLVLQSEIIEYVESMNREIQFDDDTFALDVIADTGPSGSFINKLHTSKHFRKELWFPSLLDRESYENWVSKGAQSLEERCRKKKEEILLNHTPKILSKDLAKELNNIVDSAKKNLS